MHTETLPNYNYYVSKNILRIVNSTRLVCRLTQIKTAGDPQIINDGHKLSSGSSKTITEANRVELLADVSRN